MSGASDVVIQAGFLVAGKLGGSTVNFPNSYGENKPIANGGNDLVVCGTNPDANTDDGSNTGLANAGAIAVPHSRGGVPAVNLHIRDRSRQIE